MLFTWQEKDSNLFSAQLREKDNLLDSKTSALATINLERQCAVDQFKKLKDDAANLQQSKVCVGEILSLFQL